MTAIIDITAPLPRKKASGRPRRLTIEQVLEAGLAIGLDRLTMGAVADRLGVRITVLYGYVANKDELVRLVATRASQTFTFPKDEGQAWQIYAAAHAQALFALLTGPGQFLLQYVSGGQGPELEIDRVEAWLEVMTGKDFTAQEALHIYRQLGGVVVGGAVTELHMQALQKAGVTYQEAAHRAMAMRGDDQAPLLSSVFEDFAQQAPVWRQSLVVLLQSVTAARGEHRDAGFWDSLSSAEW